MAVHGFGKGLCLLLACLLPWGSLAETLTVMVYDRGNMPADYGTCTQNPWTAYLQQQALTRLGLEVEYVSMDRSSDLSQLAMLLATNSAPDVMFTYDYALWQRLCQSGQLADLTQPLADYGGNIRKNQAAVLPYGQYQGRQYGICNQRASVEVTSGFIRKDWLERLGIALTPNEEGYYTLTPAELYDILCRFRDSGLCGAEGAPFAAYGSTAWPVLLILEAFYQQEALTDEDLFALPPFLYPGAKEGYRFLNQLYHAGLMTQDFATLGDSDKSGYIDAIVGGQVGFWINDSWFGFEDDVLSALYARDSQAEVAAVDLLGPTGRPAYKYAYSDYGMILFVPRKSAHPEAAVQYLNLLSDPEVDFTLRYGFEGEHYALADGLPVALDEAYNARTRISVGDLALMYNGCPYLGQGVDSALSIQMLPAALQPLRRQSNLVATSNTYQIPTVSNYLEEDGSLQQRLESLVRALHISCILCPAADFDRVWDACLADYLEAGGQAQIDQKRQAYRQNR